MTINDIIRKALERIKSEGKLLTPEAYGEAFCKEAKLAGMLLEECNQVDRYAQTLNKEFQFELKQYHLKTTQELIRYLISKLNRMNPTNCAQLLIENQQFTKRVLEAVELLHNKEAAELARKSIDLFNVTNPSKEQYENYRQAWVNFITNYDDAFLNVLKPYGKIFTTDIKTTITNLTFEKLAPRENNFKQIASLLVASLVPSIASSVNDKIAKLSDVLVKNPDVLNTPAAENEIKNAIKLRIALDRNTLKEMVQSLDKVLDKLSYQLIEMIEKTDQSNSDIKVIKNDLENLNREHDLDFKTAHNKLYNIAVALEENSATMSCDLKEQDEEIKALSQRIDELERELENARQSSREDFLTKLLNRRALDDLLEIKDSEFTRYGRSFSVIMFDIDFFKHVNDTYGHQAGDTVLAAFASILKKTCRTVDIVGRYGGEEFMTILSETDSDGAAAFAEKIRKQVEITKFMFQNQRIDVTVSAGVAERSRFPSKLTTVKAADEKLYMAKRNGRNRVEH